MSTTHLKSTRTSTEHDSKWWTLGVVCIAVFMLLLDVTVVNNALPSIQKDLGSSFSDLQWVVDAYALTLAALLLSFGSLADLVGRRRVFVLGLGVFSAASLLCGLSTDPLMLNLARAIQGAGAAGMFACSAALIAGAFPPQERGSAFGIFGGTIGAAVAIGPLVGGALTQGIGWEWVFFVNVPIGIGAILIALMRVAESRDPRSGHIDATGFATFSGALCLLVFALVRGNAEGWGSPLIVSFLIGAGALLVAFVAIELRTADPMFDLGLFRKPSFTGAAIVGFTLSASMFSMFLYLSLFLQNVLGLSPLQAGLRFLPLTLLSFFVAPIAGRLAGRVIPIRVLLGPGMLFVSVGLVLQGGLDADSEWTHFLPGFVLAGIGVGMINPPLATTQVGVVPPQRSGMASGIGSTFRQVGIATGIAALGAIFQHAVAAKTIDALGAAHRGGGGLGATLSSGNPGGVLRAVPPAQRQRFVDAFHTGFTGALNEILVIAAITAFVGALAGFALVRREDFVAAGPEPRADPDVDPLRAIAAPDDDRHHEDATIRAI
jgi:EmrB/QacA subfamily drug resistance transporter